VNREFVAFVPRLTRAALSYKSPTTGIFTPTPHNPGTPERRIGFCRRHIVKVQGRRARRRGVGAQAGHSTYFVRAFIRVIRRY